jgi:hypothetical protein
MTTSMAATLLVKVTAHRGDPLNEEADIRAEIGRLKDPGEITSNDPTEITVYCTSLAHECANLLY